MRSFTVGRAFGIPIRVGLTFLLVLPLLAWLIGTGVGRYVEAFNSFLGANLDAAALTAGSMPYVLGTVAAIGLFAAVVLHELGHSLVALRFGVGIESITLWFLGGIAQLTEMSEEWKEEFAVAIAGPAVSLALGALSYGAFLIVPSGQLSPVRFLFGYFAVMNIALAVFNLLPGFPMDGGRVLRALLARNRPYAQATQSATRVGQLFAIGLGLIGLLSFNVFWLAIAFFIYVGAASESRQTTMKAAFEGVRVRDVMTQADDVHAVTPETSVAELLDRMFRERHTGYPVLEDGEIVGVVTLSDTREIKEVERDAYRVAEVMTAEVTTIAASSEAITAMNAMQSTGVGRLPVIDADGVFAGLISRTDLMTALNIIQSSGTRGQSELSTGTPRRPDPEESPR
ncbi:metalloprotease [Halobacteriales archaeon QS_3_64_16]|nr:MAG: metalloprotease [Halobacteriales archaeon QS_3_64_16]